MSKAKVRFILTTGEKTEEILYDDLKDLGEKIEELTEHIGKVIQTEVKLINE